MWPCSSTSSTCGWAVGLATLMHPSGTGATGANRLGGHCTNWPASSSFPLWGRMGGSALDEAPAGLDLSEAGPARQPFGGFVVGADLDLADAEVVLGQVAEHLRQQELGAALAALLGLNRQVEDARGVLAPARLVQVHLPQDDAAQDRPGLLAQ